MNCAEFEILLCDYLDGTLPAGRRAEVEQHLSACAGCAELARDAGAAVAFMQRVPEVEPPAELLNRITFDIHAASTHAPRRSPGFRAWLKQVTAPVLQPRFAMGMAMTVLSFSMLGKFTASSVRQLTPADLSPARVWASIDDKSHRLWDRAVRFYENLRFVYELQSRITELTQPDQSETQAPPPGAAKPDRAGNQQKPGNKPQDNSVK